VNIEVRKTDEDEKKEVNVTTSYKLRKVEKSLWTCHGNVPVTGSPVVKSHFLHASRELKLALVSMNRIFYETEDNNKGLSQAQQTGIQLFFSRV
jgi:hypothetical protein